MSITLAIIDRKNGTGADALISGVGVAESVTLYRQLVDGKLGAFLWQETGSRVGGGPIQVDRPPAYYSWHARTATDLSPCVYEPITDATSDVQSRFIDAVHARIANLQLPGLTVYKRKVPWDGDLILPACVVTDFEQTETLLGGTTGHDEYGHPAFVMFRNNDAHDETTKVNGVAVDSGDLVRFWRGKVTRSFQGQHVPGVAESMWCEVEHAPITILGNEGAEMIFSALVIRGRTREPRGFGI